MNTQNAKEKKMSKEFGTIDKKFGTGSGQQAVNIVSKEKWVLTALYRQNEYLLQLQERQVVQNDRLIAQNDRIIQLLEYQANTMFLSSKE